jgi:hypothetical protein
VPVRPWSRSPSRQDVNHPKRRSLFRQPGVADRRRFPGRGRAAKNKPKQARSSGEAGGQLWEKSRKRSGSSTCNIPLGNETDRKKRLGFSKPPRTIIDEFDREEMKLPVSMQERSRGIDDGPSVPSGIGSRRRDRDRSGEQQNRGRAGRATVSQAGRSGRKII